MSTPTTTPTSTTSTLAPTATPGAAPDRDPYTDIMPSPKFANGAGTLFANAGLLVMMVTGIYFLGVAVIKLHAWGMKCLKTWGDTGYTENVRRSHSRSVALAMVQCLIDLIGFFAAFYNAFKYIQRGGGVGLAGALASAVVAGLFLYDLGMIGASTMIDTTITFDKNGKRKRPLFSKSRKMQIMRIAAAIGFAFVTAEPIEQLIFHQENEHMRTAAGRVATSAIRSSASASELARLNALEGTTQTTADADIERYRASRQPRADELAHSERQAHDAAIGEAGGRYSGIPTVGRRTRDLLAAWERTKAEQRDYNAETEREVARRTRERDQRLTSVRTERETLPTRLATMSNEELMRRFGGNTEQAKGFLADMRILRDLAAADPLVRLVIWVVRLFMIAFTLITVGKLTVHADAIAYANPAIQAILGNERARQLLIGMGIRDYRVAAMTDAQFEVYLRLLDAADEVMKKLRAFEPLIAPIVLERDANGRFLPARVVRTKLEQEYKTCGLAAAVDAYQSAALKFRKLNTGVPEWPAEFGADPTDAKRPAWLVSDEDLSGVYGWENPETDHAAIAEARKQILAAYKRLEMIETDLKAAIIERLALGGATLRTMQSLIAGKLRTELPAIETIIGENWFIIEQRRGEIPMPPNTILMPRELRKTYLSFTGEDFARLLREELKPAAAKAIIDANSPGAAAS